MLVLVVVVVIEPLLLCDTMAKMKIDGLKCVGGY